MREDGRKHDVGMDRGPRIQRCHVGWEGFVPWPRGERTFQAQGLTKTQMGKSPWEV